MGGSYVALAKDPEGMHWNPAGPSRAVSLGGSFSFSHPFELAELGTASGCALFPTRLGCLSAGVISHGFDLYRELTCSAGYARTLCRGLALGANLKANRVTIERFGEADGWGLDIGLLSSISERLDLGMALWNALGTRIAGESPARAFAVGAAGTPQPHLTLCLDARRDSPHRPLGVRCGAECVITPLVTVRVGAGVHPTRFSAGVGVCKGRCRVEYALSTHLVLGPSHHMSVLVQ